MNLKKALALTLALILTFALAACGGGTSSSAAPASEAAATSEAAASEAASTAATGGGEGGTIAYSSYDLAYEYYQTLASGVKETAEANGYTYIEHDEQSDEQTMISGCMDLINQNISCLILTAYKPEAATAIVEAAHAKDIPVIMVDFGSDELDYDVLIQSDNKEGGELAAQYALDNLADGGSKKAAIITNDPSAGSYVRKDGFEEVITGGGYEVVSVLNANSNPEEAYTCMQDVLTSNPDVEVVFCLNDSMAIASAQAITDAGKVPGEDIMVLGFNADEAVFEPIQSGQIACTIMQMPYDMGKMGVECFMQMQAGEEIQYDDAEGKIIWAPLEVISADNVANYI